MLIGSGIFSGSGGHELCGTFRLTKRAGQIVFETSEDFYFDGAPEPGWALYKGTPRDAADPHVRNAAHATRFGALPPGIVPVRGRQTAVVPDRIGAGDFDTVFLFCFGVPFVLGVGPVERNVSAA